MTSRLPLMRGFGAALAALALMLRVLVPAGYMPVATGGHIAVRICDGSAGAHASISLPAPGKHAPLEGAAHEVCPYMALGQALLNAPPALALPLPQFATLAPPPARAPSALVALARLRPPARGPPVLA